MEQSDLDRRPGSALAVTAGVLGFLGAAGSALLCLVVVGLGRMSDGGAELSGWAVVLLAAAVAQAWGALRLLRRRGRLLLALGSVPALLPLLLSVVVENGYRQAPGVLHVVAGVPVLTLVVTLLPPVRRWATTRAPVTTSGV